MFMLGLAPGLYRVQTSLQLACMLLLPANLSQDTLQLPPELRPQAAATPAVKRCAGTQQVFRLRLARGNAFA